MSDYSTYSDEQLLALIKLSDAQAFNQVYDKYWKKMFSAAMLKLNRRELAEDIVQEVFTGLWFRATRHDIKNLEAWLATAVKYKVITLLHRELKISLPAEIPDIPVADIQAEYRFLENEMETLISRLPERCQLIFRYHQENLSNQEISKRLFISEKAVEKQLTKARHSLKVSFRQILSTLFFL